MQLLPATAALISCSSCESPWHKPTMWTGLIFQFESTQICKICTNLKLLFQTAQLTQFADLEKRPSTILFVCCNFRNLYTTIFFISIKKSLNVNLFMNFVFWSKTKKNLHKFYTPSFSHHLMYTVYAQVQCREPKKVQQKINYE